MGRGMKRLSKRKRENLDFEISFYEGILQHNPDYIEVLIQLGDVYTKRGFYKNGLEVDLKLSRLCPQDPVVHYNLACSYSLVGETEKALETLKKAIQLGYTDFDYMEKDPDLESLRNDSRYKELIEEYREKI